MSTDLASVMAELESTATRNWLCQDGAASPSQTSHEVWNVPHRRSHIVSSEVNAGALYERLIIGAPVRIFRNGSPFGKHSPLNEDWESTTIAHRWKTAARASNGEDTTTGLWVTVDITVEILGSTGSQEFADLNPLRVCRRRLLPGSTGFEEVEIALNLLDQQDATLIQSTEDVWIWTTHRLWDPQDSDTTPEQLLDRSTRAKRALALYGVETVDDWIRLYTTSWTQESLLSPLWSIICEYLVPTEPIPSEMRSAAVYDWHCRVAEHYASESQWTSAIRSYSRALALNSYHDITWIQRSKCHFANGNFKEALADTETPCSRQGCDDNGSELCESTVLRGRALRALGRREEAVTLYWRATVRLARSNHCSSSPKSTTPLMSGAHVATVFHSNDLSTIYSELIETTREMQRCSR